MEKNTRAFLFLLLKLFLIWLSWKGFIFIIGEESTPIHERFFPALSLKWEFFNAWYKTHLLKVCVLLLKATGYPAWLYQGDTINIGDLSGVGVGNYCLGFQLIYYFTMILAVSEISRFQKAFGMAVGFLAVNFLNVIRLSALAIISAYYYRLSYFFHDYAFNIIVFGSLMVFYYWLVDKKSPH